MSGKLLDWGAVIILDLISLINCLFLLVAHKYWAMATVLFILAINVIYLVYYRRYGKQED